MHQHPEVFFNTKSRKSSCGAGNVKALMEQIKFQSKKTEMRLQQEH